jgi:hypothetical protein
MGDELESRDFFAHPGQDELPSRPPPGENQRRGLERLLDRMGEIRIDESAHGPADARRYAWEPTFLLRRLKALHLEFTPA